MATGKVTDQCYDRHGKAELLDFLKKVAKAYPRRELHVVLDDYHTHKRADIKNWLARNPRITLEHPLPPVHLDQDCRRDPAHATRQRTSDTRQ
jgi:hypothetical protein